MQKFLISAVVVLLLAGSAWAQSQIDILAVPRWGQSRAEIAAAFPNGEADGDDRINVIGGKAYGGELTANYFFVDDKLMYVRYDIEAFETEEHVVPQGYEDLVTGLKTLYGEPAVRESMNNSEDGPQTYIQDWIDDIKAIALQRNGEPDAIYWMRVEHIDPAFLNN